MSNPGEIDLLVQARAALLDALSALTEHRESVIVVGAQAVYLRCGEAPVALAESTKDSDLAVDPRRLGNSPLLQDAMEAAGFYMNLNGQPGAWLSRSGIPVDLMVPQQISGRTAKDARSARIPPHDDKALRVAKGLEACLVDNGHMPIAALDSSDKRAHTALVAGSAALMVAKIHKLNERLDSPTRLNDKDAHDFYRLLVATETSAVARDFEHLVADPLSSRVTTEALDALPKLFADGPTAVGSMMAGRAEAGIGNPETTAAAAAALSAALLAALAAS